VWERILLYFERLIGMPMGDFLSEVWIFTQMWMLLAFISSALLISVGGLTIWVVLPLLGIDWRFRVDLWIATIACCSLAFSYVVPLVFRLRSELKIFRRERKP